LLILHSATNLNRALSFVALLFTKISAVTIRYPASGGKKYYYAPPTKTAEFEVKIRQMRKKQEQNISCCYFCFFNSIKRVMALETCAE